MTADMLSWLRQQIENRLAVARAATQGHWEIGEPLPYSDPGSGISIMAGNDDVAGQGYSGGGVWKQSDVSHIVFNNPRQIIADCEADLRTLEECSKCLGGDHEPLMWHAYNLANRVLATIAESYGWAPEGATP